MFPSLLGRTRIKGRQHGKEIETHRNWGWRPWTSEMFLGGTRSEFSRFFIRVTVHLFNYSMSHLLEWDWDWKVPAVTIKSKPSRVVRATCSWILSHSHGSPLDSACPCPSCTELFVFWKWSAFSTSHQQKTPSWMSSNPLMNITNIISPVK